MLKLLLIHLPVEPFPPMSNPSPILESFLQKSYQVSNLPPLWEVIYQEATRGHHLLFRRTDSERYDQAAGAEDLWSDTTFGEELEIVATRIVACAELSEMIQIIDALPDRSRRNLYVMYRRVLWMWRNYVKDNMN